MANVAEYVLMDGKIVKASEANLSIASSAVLYGLSVYSVFFAKHTEDGFLGFRLPEHIQRLKQSSRMIGFDSIDHILEKHSFLDSVHELIEKNQPTTDQFFRVTIHATNQIPGVRTSDLDLTLSIFMHNAEKILPSDGARLKTSLWRRTSDTAIPARAKVNGAYVNSALAKQDALDAGFDDCLFLNHNGYVSELSAANIFMIKRGVLITPDCASDILEGITRRSIIEIAEQNDIPVAERKVALTELYTADEVFACGTSTFVSRITEIDGRKIGNGGSSDITDTLRTELEGAQSDPDSEWVMTL